MKHYVVQKNAIIQNWQEKVNECPDIPWKPEARKVGLQI